MDHDVPAVLEEFHMEMEAVPGGPLFYLGRERGHTAVFIGDVPDEPAAQDEGIGHLLRRPRRKFDLELLRLLAADLFEVGADALDEPDLTVGILDGASDLGYGADHLVEDLTALDIGGGGMVAVLFLGRIEVEVAVGEQEEL